ncbi:fumarylacetoacetate hydrolase family protein [Microtetraspora sp. NBRC 16547]|uniref:fumarylacetoacetate hydrolase family protein n=1 Tax=Microtetraspora sp. NBRC 16547 TaxID=3030993 RepID=UPI0024A5D4DA|nr:fumarylacetoacetate hydrolase family protein [Microtetraspora sp. NBRC 16547]GLW99332.1 fumarylacetoacetate hydrolase [Microtetraspora sp. NBRC 16547]
MRIATVNGRAALLDGDRYLDLARATSGVVPATPGAFLQSWRQTQQAVTDLGSEQDWQPLAGARLGAPVPDPRQSIGIGLNYAGHVQESGLDLPDFPLVFAKLPGSLCGPNDDVLLPSESVDWEAELVVALGGPLDRGSRQEAAAAIAGFMVGQDLSDRRVQHQAPGGQHTIGKSYRTFGPTGPALVTLEELADPHDLEIRCRINGEVMQDGSTAQMMVDVCELLSMLSARLPLGPGDLVFTGTPEGIGSTRNPPRFLRPGDVIETEIAGLGRLVNTCVADSTYPTGPRP